MKNHFKIPLKRKAVQLLLCVFLIIGCRESNTVQNEGSPIDLMDRSFGELFQLTEEAADSTTQGLYAKHLVKMGKRDKSPHKTAIGYHFLMNLQYNSEQVLNYADSIIQITKELNISNFPSIAYQAKGDYYYTHKAYKKAIENFLLVIFYSEKHTDNHMVYRSKQSIGDLKRLLGEYDDALVHYKQNLQYVKRNPDAATTKEYLYSIASIANVFNDKKEGDSASFYNDYGIGEALRLDSRLYYTNFALNEGITAYHKRDFQIAIDSFEKHIPYLRNIKDLRKELSDSDRLALSFLYCGKSYLEVKNTTKAMSYFKQVDSVFLKDKNIFPILREGYEHLKNYYKKKKDYKNYITYINRLIEVDSTLNADKFYLNNEIIREYDIPKLKAEKEAIISEMEENRGTYKNTVMLLSALVILLCLGFGIQYRKRKIYKKRFEDIIDTAPKEAMNNHRLEKKAAPKIDLPEKVVEDILNKLENFEKNQMFTSNKITLITLSKKLRTNPNYLSKVINHYKENSFTNYLNSLRVEYAIEQLKTNPVYRKYTIKAIAEEVGFNNVQAFAKAFYKNKGINPSYFMKALEKSIK